VNNPLSSKDQTKTQKCICLAKFENIDLNPYEMYVKKIVHCAYGGGRNGIDALCLYTVRPANNFLVA
jgi:hypothetical protein